MFLYNSVISNIRRIEGMKTIPDSKRCQHVVRVGIFLIAAALIAVMAGCGDGGNNNLPPQEGEIRTWYDLAAVEDSLAGNYTLMNDLDSTTDGYDELAGPTANDGKGWQPIGFMGGTASFTGTFDGQGHEISDLFINRPDQVRIGLFGMIDVGAVVKNLGVVDVTVTGDRPVGGLAGFNWATISNCYSTGSVTGNTDVGGLVGANVVGTLRNCYAIASVSGDEYIGGLVGTSEDAAVYDSHSSGNVIGHSSVGGLIGANIQLSVPDSYSAGSATGNNSVSIQIEFDELGTVNNSYSTADVTGDNNVGGLVGEALGGKITDSYSTGSVTGIDNVGGLMGYNFADTVTDSYSAASVTGIENVGGLVGWNRLTVGNSHSTGSVTGTSSVGGLVGYNYYGTLNNCYSAGTVTGNSSVGGLVGRNDGDVSDSFWDTEASGQATSAGGTGKNTTEMRDIATFSGAGWGIIAVADPDTRNPSYIWNIVDAVTYPFLSWQP
jgi:hypothetical protein